LHNNKARRLDLSGLLGPNALALPDLSIEQCSGSYVCKGHPIR
jgi:hypothetical protein